jgi:hypothetical protein
MSHNVRETRNDIRGREPLVISNGQLVLDKKNFSEPFLSGDSPVTATSSRSRNSLGISDRNDSRKHVDSRAFEKYCFRIEHHATVMLMPVEKGFTKLWERERVCENCIQKTKDWN